jgi:DNA-binding response OmpR family regulator
MPINPHSLPSNEAEKQTAVQSPLKKTILLVDDDELLRELFGRALRKKGYSVIEADSGVEGFEKARKNLPDLILTDMCMPEGDGVTLLRNIRDDPELKFRQVVVLSGMPDLLMPRTGTEDGADDFLMKPVNIKELLSCVQARLIHASVCCCVGRNWAQAKLSVPTLNNG